MTLRNEGLVFRSRPLHDLLTKSANARKIVCVLTRNYAVSRISFTATEDTQVFVSYFPCVICLCIFNDCRPRQQTQMKFYKQASLLYLLS
jgi:hypothetical protein